MNLLSAVFVLICGVCMSHCWELAGSDFCKGRKPGSYPDAQSCDKYIVCLNGQGFRKTCPSPKLWNPKKQACDDAKNVNCSSPARPTVQPRPTTQPILTNRTNFRPGLSQISISQVRPPHIPNAQGSQLPAEDCPILLIRCLQGFDCAYGVVVVTVKNGVEKYFIVECKKDGTVNSFPVKEATVIGTDPVITKVTDGNGKATTWKEVGEIKQPQVAPSPKQAVEQLKNIKKVVKDREQAVKLLKDNMLPT